MPSGEYRLVVELESESKKLFLLQERKSTLIDRCVFPSQSDS